MRSECGAIGGGACRPPHRSVGGGHEITSHTHERALHGGQNSGRRHFDETGTVADVDDRSHDGGVGTEDPTGVIGDDAQHLALGQRGVDGQRRFHETTQLPGIAGGGTLGRPALAPQKHALDGDGDPLGQAPRRIEVGWAVPPTALAGDES